MRHELDSGEAHFRSNGLRLRPPAAAFDPTGPMRVWPGDESVVSQRAEPGIDSGGAGSEPWNVMGHSKDPCEKVRRMKSSRPSFLTVDFLIAIGFFVVISGCQPETDGATTDAGTPLGGEVMTDWHGVTLVDELWKVGRFEGAEHEVLGRIADVTFVGSGLAIFDSHSNRIHWYDSTGQHEVSTGGSGGGPGEFRMVHSLDLVPDGTLAALNLGGGIEFFDKDGHSQGSVRFPGSAREMCVMDSTLVVLGTLGSSDLPLHLMDLADSTWTSIGRTDVPETGSPHRRLLVGGLIDGRIGCLADRVLYARSSDGTVRALRKDGSVQWEVEMPSFVPIAHEEDGERGIRHGPPEGATEVHGFAGVTRFGGTLAVQIMRLDLRTEELSLSTVFLNLDSGRILGRDDSLPLIMAAREDRIAITREAPMPEVVVYSITHPEGLNGP